VSLGDVRYDTIRLLALLRLSSRIAKYDSAIQRKNVKCQMLQNETTRVNKRTKKNEYCNTRELVEQGVLGIVIGVVIGSDSM